MNATAQPPRTSAGATAGAVLLPAIAGVNDYIRGTEDRLREAGYETSTVDYYTGGEPPELSTPGQIIAAVAVLSDMHVLNAVHRRVQDFHGRGITRVVVLGFCVGGAYAMLAGSKVEGLCAVANYYGSVRYPAVSANKPAAPLDCIAQLRAPLVAHYGTADRFVPPEDVDALESALQNSDRPHELFRYAGAPHAFDEDFRPSFRPVAAHEAWDRTLRFLNWYAFGKHRGAQEPHPPGLGRLIA
jgi:carboxymethylenebutenolidase